MFAILDSDTFLIRMNAAASRIHRTLGQALAAMAGTTTPDLLIGVARELTAYREEVISILDTAKSSGAYRSTIIAALKAELGDDFSLQTAISTHNAAVLQALGVIANLLNTKPRAWGVDSGALVQQAVAFTAAESTQVAQKLQAVRASIVGA